MMLHKKSSGRSYWKLLALLPIVGITLALNAETVTDVVYKNDKPQKQQPVKKGKANSKINAGPVGEIVVVGSGHEAQETKPVEMPNAKDVDTEEDEKIFDVVEKMPEYPGGIEKLFEYLSQNIRYPKEAMEKDIQGRVLVTFVVKKDGNISEASVVRSVDPLLDEEGLRVINAMPNWTPGMQNGEPVNVKYTVPITFRLTAKDTKKEE